MLNVESSVPLLLTEPDIDEKESQSSSDEKFSQSPESFRSTIQHFVKYAETSKEMTYSIADLCDRFGFQRRRLYDMINVFEAIGSCKKTGIDSLTWYGFDNIHDELRSICENCDLLPDTPTLESIVPTCRCITIAHLTQSLLICFLGLRCNTLEVKRTGAFLSAKNGRYKTTVCKLYQITHILEAIGMLKRGQMPGEITLEAEYMSIIDDCLFESPVSVLSIDNMLCKPHQPLDKVIESRRRHYFEFKLGRGKKQKYL